MVSSIANVLDSKPINAYVTIEALCITPSKPFLYGVFVKLLKSPKTKPLMDIIANKERFKTANVLLNRVDMLRPRRDIENKIISTSIAGMSK